MFNHMNEAKGFRWIRKGIWNSGKFVTFLVFLILVNQSAVLKVRALQIKSPDPKITTQNYLYLPFIIKPKNEWTQYSQGIPKQANFSSMAISPDFSKDNTFFVGTSNGPRYFPGGTIYRTSNGGKSWDFAGNGLPVQPINELALSPDYANDHTLFSGGLPLFYNTTGFYRSTVAGITWDPTGYFEYKTVYSIVLSPNYRNDKSIFASDGLSIHRSIDGGSTWESVYTNSDPMDDLHSLGISPNFKTDNTIFAGRSYYPDKSGKLLLRSTDRGDTWEELPTPIDWRIVDEVAISPNFNLDHILYVLANTLEGNRIYISTDRGNSWTQITDNSIGGKKFLVSPSLINDKTLFVISGGSVYRSRDYGYTWAKVFEGSYCDNILISPNYLNDRIVFAACGELLKSTDGGDSWISVSEGITTNVIDLEISPNYIDDGIIFGSTASRGVIKSTDRGKTWTTKNEGLEYLSPFEVEISPGFPVDGTVFTVDQNGVFKSLNGGDIWVNIYEKAGDLAISPNYLEDQTIVLADSNVLMKSIDGGLSWKQISLPLPINVVEFSQGYKNDQKIYVLVNNSNKIGISSDGGISWIFKNLDHQVNGFLWKQTESPRLVSSTLSGDLCQSDDLGENWSCNQLPTSAPIISIAIYHGELEDDVLIAGTAYEGIFLSKDDGSTWQEFNEGLESFRINDLVSTREIHPRIFAATDWGVWSIMEPIE